MAEASLSLDVTANDADETQPPKRKVRRRSWKNTRPEKRMMYTDFASFTAELRNADVNYFQKYAGMSCERFEHLLGLVTSKLTRRSTRPDIIAPAERLILTLRYLVTGYGMTLQAANFGIGMSTAAQVVRETCQALWSVLAPAYMPVPADADEWRRLSAAFRERCGFPNALGALQIAHFVVDRPRLAAYEDYAVLDTKEFHAIALIALVDADSRFTMVDIGGYEFDDDNDLLDESQIGAYLDDPDRARLPASAADRPPYVACTDDAVFRMRPWLMRAFAAGGGKLTAAERAYNARHATVTRAAHDAFRRLTSRFGVLRKPIRGSLESVEAIVQGAACLHNYLTRHADPDYCRPLSAQRDCEHFRVQRRPFARAGACAGGASLGRARRVRKDIVECMAAADRRAANDEVVAS